MIVLKRKRKRDWLLITELLLGIIVIPLMSKYIFVSIPNFLNLDPALFIDAIRDLNNAVVFAAFMALFLNSENPNISDASKHPSYIKPAIIFIVNSFLLCLLSSLEPIEKWEILTIVLDSIIMAGCNMYILYKFSQLALAKK